jgi:PKD repeat protein
VGAVDKLGKLASFSSRGNQVHHPTVMAPGHFIASVRATAGPISSSNATPFDLTDPAAPRMLPFEDWPYYTVKSGTSMAAPHVSGVVALMLEANPALTPTQVKSILASTALPVAGCAVSDCGNGIVSALGAVRAGLQLSLPVNVAPVARLVASVTSGAAPLAVSLDASSSSDADGSVVSYLWDWEGDGQVDSETSSGVVARTFAAGVHRPSVVAVDDDGVASSPVAVEVRASNPPVASATAPSKARSGEPVAFDASASYDPDGSIVAYEWNFGDGSPVVTTTRPTVTHAYVARRAAVLGWSVRVVDDADVVAGAGGSIRITP